MKHIALFAVLLFASYVVAQDNVRVTGTVINGADGNPLPFCFVHLMQDGRSKVYAVTDYAGNYTIPATKAGAYDLLVVQFGDTLMHCRGITLGRDTRVRCVVSPPADGEGEAPVTYSSAGFMQLRPVLVVGRYNMLASTGHLITSPDDPRLWNMSGKMDPVEPEDRSFFYSIYKVFFRLREMGYQITSPFELIYPEIYHPASDSSAVDYNIWILGFKF